MIRRWLPGLLGTCLFVVHPGGVTAQGTTATVRINLPVTEMVTRLHASPGATDFGVVSVADLLAGLSQAAGPLLDVKSNRGFAVTIAAATAMFAGSGKSSAEMSWATSAGGPYTSLITTGATVVAVPAGGFVLMPVFFRLTWDLAADPPGLYELLVTFTIAAP